MCLAVIEWGIDDCIFAACCDVVAAGPGQRGGCQEVSYCKSRLFDHFSFSIILLLGRAPWGCCSVGYKLGPISISPLT